MCNNSPLVEVVGHLLLITLSFCMTNKSMEELSGLQQNGNGQCGKTAFFSAIRFSRSQWKENLMDT